MPDPTPGQRCYEAYWTAHDPWWHRSWAMLSPGEQGVWEAAAEAVLEADSDGRHTPQEDTTQ
jgi:hypothetical protein